MTLPTANSAPIPCLPDYGANCVSNIVPTLVAKPAECPRWFPGEAHRASQVVLLVLDGLGWCQLQDRLALAPNLAAMRGGYTTTVCPTTTAAALSSITTGLPPGEHGVVGYRMRVQGTVLNTLRWRRDDAGDARRSFVPEEIQPYEPFLASHPSVITKAEFATSGFTQAHLRGGKWAPWYTPSNIATQVHRQLRAGERLIYAYYDGIDKVAHAFGLGEHYDAELAFVDDMVGSIRDKLPPEATLLVTADHGQVDVGDAVVKLPTDLAEMVTSMSGEGRFRWLHTRPDRVERLDNEATAAFGHQSWVVTRDQIIDEGWLGPRVGRDAIDRLGDVALVPFEPISHHDPDDVGLTTLIGRHGSMTEAEVFVPLLVCASDSDT